MKRFLCLLAFLPSLISAGTVTSTVGTGSMSSTLGSGNIALAPVATGGGGGSEGTFGNIGYSASAGDYEAGTSPRIYLGKFALSQSGAVDSITMLMDAQTSAINVKAVIYDDDATDAKPGTLKGVSSATSVSTTKGDFSFTFSPAVSLTAGDYWIGMVGESGSTWFFFENETGTCFISENNNYTTPTSNPTQSALYTGEGMCITAHYTY